MWVTEILRRLLLEDSWVSRGVPFVRWFLAGEPKPSMRRVRLRVFEDGRNTYIVPGESPDTILTSTRLESSTPSNPRGRIIMSQECRWE